MKYYKVIAVIALCAIPAVAYAGAVYLVCDDHPDALERYVSYGDCLKGLRQHNLVYHDGIARAGCRRRRR